MSITKQILFISRPKKTDELAQQLYKFSQENLQNGACTISDIYSCDDDSNEFMLYMQWENQEAYQLFEKESLKPFEEVNKIYLLKTEILRLD